MRVENWHTKDIFKTIEGRAVGNANSLMDEVVLKAKVLCPPPGKTNISRPPGWSKANVSFTPKTGKNKGKLVSFTTTKRWVGREPGNLRDTIRRVNKTDSMRETIRAYAGNFKIYWALYIEKGTLSTGWGGPSPAYHFLKPPFHATKSTVVNRIKNGGSL